MSVYLDHAATTPLRPDARDAWLAASDLVGNASAVHSGGRTVRRVLEDARERIARALDCEPVEVVLTSGGTEAINLAVKGLWWARAMGREAIVLPEGEHHATRDTVGWLAGAEHAQVRSVALHATGAIALDAWRDALPDAAVATALVANNECGTVADVAQLTASAAAAGVPLHLDAVGAVGHLDVGFARWRGDAAGPAGLCALSVSGHKVGAPAGTGALVVSRFAQLSPLVHGGGQQRGLRSGTPDVAGAAALAVALEGAVAERVQEAARLTALRDRLVAGIRAAIPEARLLGDPVHRLPGNVHILFPGVAADTLLMQLDAAGVSVSAGAACQAGAGGPSPVVVALGHDLLDARSALRMTLGRTSTSADVNAALAALPGAHRRALAAMA